MKKKNLNHLTTQHSESPSVLIADDDEATRILLRQALKLWGYQVKEAADGEEAWEILKQPNPPQILTLDWLMPKLNGIELCKRIENELDFHPYIIFLTRMSGTENIIQGLEAGADEFIIKPFDLAELRIRVFAGERIIKYRDQFAEENKQLQNYIKQLKSTSDKTFFGPVEVKSFLTNTQTMLEELSKKINDNDKISAQQQLNLIQKSLQDFHIAFESKTLNIRPHIKNKHHIHPAHPVRLEIQPSRALINMQRMHAFFGNDVASIQDFIHTFISLASKQIQEIHTAIQNKDDQAARYYFHLLGSASGNSGIMPIYEICGVGEEQSTKENWEASEKCYQDLEVMLNQLREEAANLNTKKS